MRLTISPTPEFALAGDLLCRIWRGKTDQGTEVVALMAGVAIEESQVKPDEVSELFDITPEEDRNG